METLPRSELEALCDKSRVSRGLAGKGGQGDLSGSWQIFFRN